MKNHCCPINYHNTKSIQQFITQQYQQSVYTNLSKPPQSNSFKFKNNNISITQSKQSLGCTNSKNKSLTPTKSDTKSNISHPSTKYNLDIGCQLQDFYRRQNYWLTNKQLKIVKQKLEQEQIELKECTFSPIINPSNKIRNKKKEKENKPLYTNVNRDFDLNLSHKKMGKTQNYPTRLNFHEAQEKIRERLLNIQF